MSEPAVMTTTPCPDCPFRKDAPRGYWARFHFLDIWRGCQDDGIETMLCHEAGALPEEERPRMLCRGWLSVLGFEAIGARIAAARGLVRVEEVGLPSTVPLYTFAEMMEAEGIEPPERNLAARRRPIDGI